MKNYDIIYSIGTDCACAVYLKRHKLRLSSGPFDWLTNADFKDRFNYLNNDFDNFLNKEDFYPLAKNPNINNDNHCDYYENKRTGFYFYHDFPANSDFDTSFHEVKLKYTRRIDRFYLNIRNKNKILLVWFSHYHNTSDESVKEICESFSQKVGKEIDFLIVEHAVNTPSHSIERKQLTNHITRVSLNTIKLDERGNITTMGNEEACNAIFSGYRLRVPTTVRVQRWLIKIIPLKAWRKKLRAALLEG